MGWIKNKILNWSTGVQTAEVDQFIGRLASMDGSEIGMIVAVATDKRHAFFAIGWNLLEPQLLQMQHVTAAMQMNKLIRDCQAKGEMVSAAGLMVWLHTLRAAENPDLRARGRQLWRQLERGFPHVEDAMIDCIKLGLPILNIEGYDAFPSGLTPDLL